ncbi:hypothetical protein [Wolbachia endosymbiont of Wuchereria bancrofti]|uniref:hypothetical protein n=1 Tax=Wolbachia endosymbiont of Wuchereria bancrofti TaxID=96496 RepID=UPI0003478F3F|nr:hypothetical protein [Wolbachia endosymbiont of Wuchereria bancrofti]OWZ25219.1 hypothetical protein CCY16_00696 [Wolbachia endosymbiont of Wuchereria bancrofti]
MQEVSNSFDEIKVFIEQKKEILKYIVSWLKEDKQENFLKEFEQIQIDFSGKAKRLPSLAMKKLKILTIADLNLAVIS